MPKLLKKLDIVEWIISPVQKISSSVSDSSFVGLSRIFPQLARLQNLADEEGISLVVEDELARLSAHETLLGGIKPRVRLRSVPSGISLIRMSPGGYCSLGYDVARTLDNRTAKWIPEQINAASFISILENQSLVPA
jgi:hypothetical protein